MRWLSVSGGRLFQKDIERVLMLSNPAVTGIVQRLESKGLIERNVAFSDSRHKEIHTTEKSRRLAIRLGELRREHEKMLMDGISDEEKAAVLGGEGCVVITALILRAVLTPKRRCDALGLNGRRFYGCCNYLEIHNGHKPQVCGRGQKAA